MLLSSVWFGSNNARAYSLFAPLSRDVRSENACEMAVMRNDIAGFWVVLKWKERGRFLKKAA
jgi:hypothetical protein